MGGFSFGQKSSIDDNRAKLISVRGQEHTYVESRALRGFFISRIQVLVLWQRQEIVWFSDLGQETT
jgi:hypothetical protein